MLTTLSLALLPLAPLQALAEGDEVDFEPILAEARARYGLAETDLGSVTVDGVLDSEYFLRAELGPFELRLPIHAASEKEGAELMREAALTMLDVLDVWVAWTRVEKKRIEAVREDVDEVRDWVEDWSARSLARAADEATGSLYERTGASDDVMLAAKRLSEATSPRHDVELGGVPARIVLAPTRRTFAELVTLFGALEPARKPVLWDDESVFYSAGWSTDWQVVALEYPAWPWNADNPFLGDSMNLLHKNGRRQHVVDRSAASLLRAVFNSIASPLIEQALRTNLVIEVVGEERPTSGTWSFQWSRAGGSTSPYSRFVPGGNSAGGTLPPRPASAGPGSSSSAQSAESPFRDGHGKDHFEDVLKDAQKEGAKLARTMHDLPDEIRRDKTAHFAIGVLGRGDETAVSAPFLGDAAEGKPLPEPQFVDEYEEFFRAYRAGFLHWLRTNGHADGKKRSPEAFAELLQRLRRRGADETLSAVVAEVYGEPLSTPSRESGGLEWRFLERVSR